MLSNEELKGYKECSGNLWRLFKDFVTDDYTNKEKAMNKIFTVFRDHVKEYAGRGFYSYAVQYAQTLTYELERMLYPGKIKPEVTQNIKYMSYAEFVEYIKNPEPGDMVTVLNEQGGNLARIKVRTVIQT